MWSSSEHQQACRGCRGRRGPHALEILDSPENDSYTLTVLLGNIAEVHFLTGEHEKALTFQTRCLAITREYGHRLQEALTLFALGDIHAALGRTSEARTAWSGSATLCAQLGVPELAEAEQRLSTALHARDGTPRNDAALPGCKGQGAVVAPVQEMDGRPQMLSRDCLRP